jgi:hypothetical protein
MPNENRTVKPGPTAETVRAENGEVLRPPAHWRLLPPGDAPLTKRVKAKGPTWLVQVKVGRRLMSRGIWADGASIEAATAEMAAMREAPGYEQGRARAVAAREKKEEQYREEFRRRVLVFLDFHPFYRDVAEAVAQRVTDLATPVGSNTVARTARIPVEERAAAATIAWLRHHTTAYDRMNIARIKGQRRQVRRELAALSLRMLDCYRRGAERGADCPLAAALHRLSGEELRPIPC